MHRSWNLPDARELIRRATRPKLYTTSFIGTTSGKMSRAIVVFISRSGIYKTALRSSEIDTGKVHIESLSFMAICTPPLTADAALSACPSNDTANSRIFSLLTVDPVIALAADNPPTIAAALLPSPRSKGILFSQDM